MRMRRFIILITICLLYTISFLIFERTASSVGTVKIVETFNPETSEYTMDTKFEINGFKQAKDIKLILLHTDNTYTSIPLQKSKNNYSSGKQIFIFNKKEKDNYLLNVKPSQIITWKVDKKSKSKIIR